MNTRLYLNDTFVKGMTFADGTPIPVGYYRFNAEGKMELPDVNTQKNGVIDGYLYINDVRQTRYKLVAYDGDFYFINDGDKVAVNTRLYLNDAFVKGMTFADGTPIPAGYYRFDAEGKMIVA